MIGQLSSFALDADPGNLPKFNYLELGDAFEVMFARVLSLLSGSIEQHYTEIPLEHRADGMFIGKVGDPKLFPTSSSWPSKATLADALVRERFPAVMKMAGWNHIYEVVKQARYGVTRRDRVDAARRAARQTRHSASSACRKRRARSGTRLSIDGDHRPLHPR